MKKFAVMMLVVVALVSLAGIASAREHGNIGGVGTSSQPGIWIRANMEHGNIGGF